MRIQTEAIVLPFVQTEFVGPHCFDATESEPAVVSFES